MGNIKTTLEQWSQSNGAELFEDRGNNFFQLSWHRKGDTGYIDIYPDRNRPDVAIVQHGTFDPATDEGCVDGVSRWRWEELPQNLTELKKSIDSSERSPDTWKYTPSVNIGSVKGFKFR